MWPFNRDKNRDKDPFSNVLVGHFYSADAGASITVHEQNKKAGHVVRYRVIVKEGQRLGRGSESGLSRVDAMEYFESLVRQYLVF